jgi:DNA-binding response OmpR family regulator
MPDNRPPTGTRKRILVVDDEPEVAELVVQILETSGFEAWAIDDPLTVVQRAEELRPDLVILDFDMPKILGSDLAVRLKSKAETRGIPIIFLSGMTDEDHQTIAAMSGGEAYIEKPVQKAKLLETIRTILNLP